MSIFGRITSHASSRSGRDREGPPTTKFYELRDNLRIADALSQLGIAGGAVYDALVALAAVEHNADLATRDLRAKATYEAVGARVIVAR